MKTGTPESSGGTVAALSFALCFAFIFPFVCHGADSLIEVRTDSGLTTTEPYAYLLMEQARSEPARKNELLKKAHEYAPNLPAVYFALAKENFDPSMQGLLRSFDYFRQGILAYGRNFWWGYSMAGMAFLALAASCGASLLMVALVRLPADIPLIYHESMEDRRRLALLGIPALLSFFGLAAFIAGALFVVGLSVVRWNRLVAYAAFFFLFCLPFMLGSLNVFLSAPPALKAVVEVNESKESRYAAGVLSERKDFVSLFSYALALKRSGGYAEAIDILKKVSAETSEEKSRVLVNLGNAFFGNGDPVSALDSYRKALTLFPLPSAYYNLSQIHRDMLEFEKGEEYFQQAARISPVHVSRFAALSSRNPNRFVVDETLPDRDLWKFALGLAKRSVVSIPAAGSFLAIILIPLFFYVSRNMKYRARRCRRCGEIYCARCVRTVVLGETCPPCYQSLVRIDELDPRERVARLLLIYHQRQKKRQITKALSLICPGAAQAYTGRTLIGWIFAWCFFFCLGLIVLNTFAVGVLFPFKHPWVTPLAVAGLIAVYAASVYHIVRRLQKGWL